MSAVGIAFQWVPEPKRSKNRLHLDVVATGGQDVVSELVQTLGGSREPEGDHAEEHWRWRVMRNPEGNEFCLIPEG